MQGPAFADARAMARVIAVLGTLALVGCPTTTETVSPVDSGVPDATASPDARGSDAGCADGDGDGHRASSCGGDDCDDADPSRAPGLPEVCDAANLDEDCDPATFGTRDGDRDGFVSSSCCNGASCGDDCDDARNVVYPGNSEVCDGFDNDCDTAVDEGVQITFYQDIDGDIVGSSQHTMLGCTAPLGYVLDGGDCDDSRRDVHPGLIDGPTANCDGLDNDCDGAADTGCPCVDGRTRPCGLSDVAPCHFGTQTCAGASWGACLGNLDPMREICNSIDDDCNGSIDDGARVACFGDADHDTFAPAGSVASDVCADTLGHCPVGYTATGPGASSTDCNDAQATIHPGALEQCNTVDDDCDRTVDEMAGIPQWRDADGDGHGSSSASVMTACALLTGYVSNHDDCNDSDGAIRPGALQTCRLVDDDCDGVLPSGTYSMLGSAWCMTLPHVIADRDSCENVNFVGCAMDREPNGARCATGWADCDSTGDGWHINTANGCETDVTTSADCGSCDVHCYPPQQCVDASAVGLGYRCQ